MRIPFAADWSLFAGSTVPARPRDLEFAPRMELENPMKLTHLILLAVAGAAAAGAQTPPKPAAPATAKAKSAASSTRPLAAAAGTVTLPPGVPPVPGIQKIAFSLRYQDI